MSETDNEVAPPRPQEASEKPRPQAKNEILLNREWCKGCGICVDVCPRQVLVMEGGMPMISQIERCNGCQLCEIHCPDLALCVVCGRRRVEVS